MATSIEPAVLALVGTVVGGLISFTATAWAEKRRSQEAREFLNHAERTDAAAKYLAAFDDWRRCKRDPGCDWVGPARAHSFAIIVLGLYFDDRVFEAAIKAAACVDKIGGSSEERKAGDADAKKARNEVIIAMRPQLGERILNLRNF